MKKLLGMMVLGLLICNISSAGDKFKSKKALKEPFANLASIEKAKNLLDWEPKMNLNSWIASYKNE